MQLVVCRQTSQKGQASWGNVERKSYSKCPTVLLDLLSVTDWQAYVAVYMHAQELNPIPYTGIVAQTSGQVIYSAVIKNWFVFLANAPGLVIGLWLTLSTLPHASLKVETASLASRANV